MRVYSVGIKQTLQDAHASEYVCSADERRSFLTGFSGSAGSALVTAEKALLWTDSRYFLQAEKQLAGTEWVLILIFVRQNSCFEFKFLVI